MNLKLFWTFFFAVIFNNVITGRTLDQIALEILSESPEYKVKSLSFEKDSLQWKTSYNLPDPEIGGEYLFAPESSDNRWAADLNWGLEWPGVYDARKKEAQERIEAARKNLEAERIDRLVEIKQSLLDYILTHKKLEILDHTIIDLDSIYILAQQYVEKGIITALDLYKVKLEYANVKGARTSVLNEQGDAVSALSRFYGKDCQDLLNVMDCEFPDIYIPSGDELKQYIENSPQIESLSADTKVAEMSKKVASRESLPSLSVGYKHAFEEDTHFNGILLGISLPIFSSKGKHKAAQAAIVESEIKANALESELNSSAEQSLRQLTVLKNQINEIEPLVVTTDYHTMLLKAYESRVISLLDYLSERNYFNNALLELLGLKHSAASIQTELLKYSESSR